MILVAGGTGLLGREVVRLLTARRLSVRVLTRDAARAQQLKSDLVNVAIGDVRDPESVRRALDGIEVVVSAIHGFAGPGGVSPRSVDDEGNRTLIHEAEGAGAQHFVLMSVVQAAPDHPMELFRAKFAAEQALRSSRLAWTIIRATAYMETWARIIGAPLVSKGKTMVFGRGDNPINFVSAYDVARFVELAVVDPGLRGAILEVGGPEDLSMKQVAQIFAEITGRSGKVRHIPLSLMRVMSVLLKPIKPGLARQIGAGVIMDTHDLRFDASDLHRRYPSLASTTFAEAASRDYRVANQVAALAHL